MVRTSAVNAMVKCITSTTRTSHRQTVRGSEASKMHEDDLKYMGDDITFCWAHCKTDCRRKPEHIILKDRPHSYADFSRVCMAYEPKEDEDDSNNQS